MSPILEESNSDIRAKQSPVRDAKETHIGLRTRHRIIGMYFPQQKEPYR